MFYALRNICEVLFFIFRSVAECFFFFYYISNTVNAPRSLVIVILGNEKADKLTEVGASLCRHEGNIFYDTIKSNKIRAKWVTEELHTKRPEGNDGPS